MTSRGARTGTEPADAVATTDGAVEATCETELRTIETAVVAYEAGEGTSPTAVADLVPGYLSDLPYRHELRLAADGTVEVVPVPDAACA